MISDRDVIRVVETWLDEEVSVVPDRVLDAVLDRVPSTAQRRVGWPTRWLPTTRDGTVRFGMAAAAVVLVALMGLQLLRGAGVGGPQASPTPTPSPTPTAAASPSPTRAAAAFPRFGSVPTGRNSMTLAGVPLTMDFTTSDWTSNGQWGIDKGDPQAPAADSASFILWPDGAADNVYSDPCAKTKLDPPAGPSAAELAAAMAEIPGLELVSAPSAVTVGGKPAQHVVLRVPDTIGCAPNDFFLWYDADFPASKDARYAGAIGETIYVWIIDVNGTTVFIDASTWAGSGPAAVQEVQQIVDSIQFE